MDYWLQISITVEQPAVQRITEAMDGLGAVAVSRQHAGGSARFDTASSDFQGWTVTGSRLVAINSNHLMLKVLFGSVRAGVNRRSLTLSIS